MIMEAYNRMHRYYEKIDGLLALLVCAVGMLIFYFAGLMWRMNGSRLFVPASVLSLVVVVAAMFIRKQGPRTVGIISRDMWKSVLLGLITGAAYFFAMRVVLTASLFERVYGGITVIRFMGRDRFAHLEETPLIEWLPLVLVFIIITAVHQEILMRGYVQTRLNGLFKSEIVATFLTGFLFIIFYMPLHGLLMDEGFTWVFLSSIPLRMAWMFALHCWLYFLYRLYNNIAAPIIFHIFFSFHSNATLLHSFFMGF